MHFIYTSDVRMPESLTTFRKRLEDPKKLRLIAPLISSVDLQVKLAKHMIVGSDFEVYAVLTNNSMQAKSYRFMLFARAVRYNSTRGESCGFSSDPGSLAPGEGQW